MKTHSPRSPYGFPMYSESLPAFHGMASLSPPSRYFTLLIACDATSLNDDLIVQAARSLVDKGLVYLCAWGPDCERVHDLFDEVAASLEAADADRFYMTTWHDEEELGEALWFLLHCACPNDDYWDDCSMIAVAIGNDEWARQIDASLSDPSLLDTP